MIKPVDTLIFRNSIIGRHERTENSFQKTGWS